MSYAARLQETIRVHAPGANVQVTRREPPQAVIEYADDATDQQRAAAESALTAFDWSQAAHDAWVEDQQPERKQIRQAAAAAIVNNDAFLADASVTNAEVLAQVKALTRQTSAIIKRLIQL